MNPESGIWICVFISGGFGDLRKFKDSCFFLKSKFLMGVSLIVVAS